MSGGPDPKPTLRDHKAEAESFLSQIATALGERGVTSERATEGGVATLVVTDPHGEGRDAASLVVDSDSWIECTWTPLPGTDAHTTASIIIAVLTAIHLER